MKLIAILLASNGGHSIGMGLLVGLAFVLISLAWNAVKKSRNNSNNNQ